MPRREHRPSPAEPTLDGMPHSPAQPPTPTAGDLVAAWCIGWSSTHGGAKPDASVVKRVSGICRSIAKDRTDLDSWRAAWYAAQEAGRRGRYDVVAHLAAPAPVGRANHYLELARTSQAPTVIPTPPSYAAELTTRLQVVREVGS